jgi:GNAT superfamily N-acetyltransferase
VVARPHRHRGLGNLLLSSAEARLEAVRALRLQTIVVETDQPATSFWQTTSWQRQSERLRFTKPEAPGGASGRLLASSRRRRG